MAVSDIRYKRLGYVALTVTDLARSEQFYREILGANTERSPDGKTVLVRVSGRHHDLVLSSGGEGGLKRLGWQMESPAAADALAAHLRELGIDIGPVSDAEAKTLGLKGAFRATEPSTGTTFEFYLEMESGPAFQPTHTNIARLGHVVINSARKSETERFLVEEMNFRVSDKIGSAVTFMRCFPNPLHHSFGVGGGEKSSLGHINFMVTNMDDVDRANIRMRKNDVPIVFGPGRHPTSNSIFFYFLDPDGIVLEYSFGMEEFPEVGAREPREFPLLPESFDEWGGAPDVKLMRPIPIES